MPPPKRVVACVLLVISAQPLPMGAVNGAAKHKTQYKPASETAQFGI